MEHFADIPIIDAHVHLTMAYSMQDSLKNFRATMEQRGYDRMVFMAYSESSDNHGDPLNGLKALWYKLQIPNTYACGCLVHRHNEHDTAEGYRNQAECMWDMGFDGMKMLEGKPQQRKDLGHRLDDPIFDAYYGFLEESGMPLTLHLADPSYFWDRDKIPEAAVKRGWFCGDGTYPTYEQFYEEMFGILTKFPKIKLTLAHFGFMSWHKDWAERFLGDYENTCLDLTPGGEMFAGFSADPAYWREFFLKNRRRIYFGTDTYNDFSSTDQPGNSYGRMQLVRTFLETGTDFTWPTVPGTLHPFALPEDVLWDIYRNNALRRFGDIPRRVCTRGQYAPRD